MAALEEEEVNPKGRVFDLVLPVAVLIVTAIGAMIYTGYLDGATNVIDAFAGCDAEVSLIFVYLCYPDLHAAFVSAAADHEILRLYERIGRRL